MRRSVRVIIVVLIHLAGVSIGAAGAAAAPDAASRRDRPNILLLITDDQRADAPGAAGHPVIRTPNLDRLAARGVRFTHAFAVDPTCMPSRATFFLGQSERRHRLGFSSPNKMTAGQWEASYPALLRRAGYHTGFVGKFGIDKFEFAPEKQFDYCRAAWGKTSPSRDAPAMPLVRGNSIEWRDAIFLENLFVGQGYPLGEGIRTSRWKYVRYRQVRVGSAYPFDPSSEVQWYEQLFDLAADPGETKNLSADAAAARTLEELRTKCEAESRQGGR